MKTLIINKIDTLFVAVNYFEQIISTDVHDSLIVDFSQATFLRNHYLSIIGMGLEVLRNQDIKIKIIEPNDTRVLNSMKKIGFLSVFSNQNDGQDTYKTMIKYTNIPLKNYDEPLQNFYIYFIGQIQGKVGNLSPKLLNKILQKILELFSNVFRHSQSEIGLFCSGQFYPGSDKFNFTIADNGVTIKNNVNTYLKKKFKKNRNLSDKIRGKRFQPLSAHEAIKWALEDTHSSTGAGGLGLSLLMELISLSKGSIEIISNNGYYSIKNGIEQIMKLESSFEGTVVSIQLNTDSDCYYFLKEERANDNN